jgi:MinD-like ATPase involved in chromosome partitioning or flagellar assembly
MIGRIITYIGPGHSGRTTTVLNTAHLLAKEGYETLVIDADQTMGTLITHLNLEKRKTGLAEVVTGLDETVYQSGFAKDKKTGVTFVTLPDGARCSGLFGLTRLQAETFYDRVKNEFDFILIDCGNILYEALSGTALLAASVVYMVLPLERRGTIWLAATEPVIEALKLDNVGVIVVNLHEVPEIPINRLWQWKREERPYVLPYISNMRDYQSRGEIFLQDPSGKKTQEYHNELIDVGEQIRGERHV